MTAVSGYLAKEILAALQTEVLDDYGSQTVVQNEHLEIQLTAANKKDYLYQIYRVIKRIFVVTDTREYRQILESDGERCVLQ